MLDAICKIADLRSWLHPERWPAGLEVLNERQQNRLLLLQYGLTVSSLEDIISFPNCTLIAIWPQLSRLCLLTGSLGYIRQVNMLRLQSLYYPKDLSYITNMSLQLYPWASNSNDKYFEAKTLCWRGWEALCGSLALSALLKQAGELALPPCQEGSDTLQPIMLSPRFHQILSKIIHWIQYNRE